MKKVLSLVLVIAMVLSSMSFAFAGTFKDVTGDYEEAVNTLAALGVVTGYEDGTYKPERVVTRAEMAKLIVEILGYGDLVAGSKSNFTDTQGHWADAWIALAAGKGLVVGTGDGKFTPDRQVSYDEAITMVVRALGYTDASNELKGMTWPTNFKVKAAELKLLKDVKLAATGADRGGVAQLLFNALEATLVTVTNDGDVTYIVDSKNRNIPLLSRLATLDEDYDVTPDSIDEDSKYYAGNVVDLEQYMYQNLQVYLNEDKDVVYVKESNSLVLTGILNDAADVTANKLIVEDADEDDNKFNITTKSAFMVNGVSTDIDNLAVGKADIKVTVVLDAENDDKIVDGLDVVGVVAEKATKEVQISTEYKTGRTRFSGIVLPVDSDDDVKLSKVTVIGADSLEDITEDSIVTVYEGLNAADKLEAIKLVVGTDVVEGKITKLNYNGTVATLGGKAYDASAFTDGTAIVGETGKLYLNAAGEFFTFDTKEETAKDYAVVVSRTNGKYDEFLEANEKDAKVKLATKDDEEVIYSLAEEAEINGVEFVANADKVTLDVVAKLDANRVVEFSLDKDGKIDAIDYVTFDKTNLPIATDSKAFILAKNAVIFDGHTADKYQVLTADQLKDDIKADVVYNKDGEIELLFVREGVDAIKSGTYAVINNVEVTVNDDNDKVYLITAYVDGNKVSYFTDKAYYRANTDASALRSALRGGFKLNEFTMDGDVITDVTTEGAFKATDVTLSTGNVKTVKATNGVITLADGTVVVLADEAVVYLQTGTATVEVVDISDIDADSTATTSSTEGDVIKALDTDNDGEYDIVIIKER